MSSSHGSPGGSGAPGSGAAPTTPGMAGVDVMALKKTIEDQKKKIDEVGKEKQAKEAMLAELDQKLKQVSQQTDRQTDKQNNGSSEENGGCSRP